MAGLEISLLGGFLLRRDEDQPHPIASRAGRSLLAYLVLNRERVHTRDLVAGTFWPDLPDSTARRRLSQALWQIQSAIGSDASGPYVVTTADGLRFNPDADVWIDVDAFEHALDTAAAAPQPAEAIESLESGTALYRGDLLAGFYDDWMLPDQERLRERFLSALARLSDLLTGRGDYERALAHARRLTRHDPLREDAHRRVMRLAVLLGRHNEALQQFETCRRILDEELGAGPTRETIDLYEATIAERDAAMPPPAIEAESSLFDADVAAPFVGRERERTVLVEMLDAALDGRGGVVLIEGESGVGKSRLLVEVARDARWRGMDVMWGRTSPSGGRPYEPLVSGIDGLSPLRRRQLARHLDPVWRDLLAPIVPIFSDASGHAPAAHMPRTDDQARMREAWAVTVTEIARITPVLVVLEDVHWADDDTVQAVSRATARAGDSRVVIAISYRHGEARERAEVWGLLREIDRLTHCERLSLAPCTPALTEELIRRSLGLTEVNAAFSDRVHRETGGNPLFIIESLRALHEEGALDEAQGPSTRQSRRHRGLPLTTAVHERILGRLEGLDDSAHRTLETIAVHSGELDLAEILAAAAADDRTTLAAVDDLVRRRLIAERDGWYSVSHELLRRVVCDGLVPSTRAGLHRRVAMAVEQHRPEEAEVLAVHYTEANMPGRAAAHHEMAAERALRVHAYDAAAGHLAGASAALDAIEAAPEHRFRIALLHEEVLDTLARRSEQEAVLQRLNRFTSADDRSEVSRRRAWFLAHQDRFAEAEAEGRRAVALARQRGNGGQAVAALSTLGLMACLAGRAADGVVFLEEAALLDGADTRQQADARTALGHNLIDLQRFDEAEQHLSAAFSLYEQLDDARGRTEVLGLLGMLRMERGEPENAEADLRRAIDLSRAIGYRYGEAVYEMNLGILLALDNRASEALLLFEAAAGHYEAMGNRRGRGLVLANSAWLRHAILGDHTRATEEASEALEIARSIDDLRGEAQCLSMLGSLAASRGSPKEAQRLLHQATSSMLSLDDSWLAAQSLRELASVELMIGAVESAIQHAAQAELLCEEKQMDDLAVSVRATLGRALLSAGRTQDALEATSRAMLGLGAGIDFAHQVPFAHSLALEAAGHQRDADKYLHLAYSMVQTTLAGLSDPQRETALEHVSAYREVVARWRERQPRQLEAKIAAMGAPSGRALKDEEFVTVTWTLSDPSDRQFTNRRELRRHRLLRLVTEATEQGGSPTVADLAEALAAGVATVRRDLAALRADGRPVPTRGTTIRRPDQS